MGTAGLFIVTAKQQFGVLLTFVAMVFKQWHAFALGWKEGVCLTDAPDGEPD